MFGNSKNLEDKNKQLQAEIEKLKHECQKWKQKAQDNWKKYEKFHNESLQETVTTEKHNEKISIMNNQLEKAENEAKNLRLMLIEENEKHTNTQRILDRKKQQCKRYKNKIERLEKIHKLDAL